MKNVNFVVKIVGCLTGAIIVGCILVILVYALPTGEMNKNIARSSDLFNYEGIYPQWANGYKCTQLDNWTDASLLANAIYPGTGNTISDAMNNIRREYADKRLDQSLTLQANGVKGETTDTVYGRYWHGSLVFVKPLLLFFDVSDIRLINMILQLALLFYIVYLFSVSDLKKYLIPFFIGIVIINPITMSMSISFSSEYNIMLLSVVIVITQYEKLKSNYKFYFLFLYIGIATAYFNEMSFPLVTLGVPLVIYILLDRKKWKQLLHNEIVYSFLWGIGYFGMWVGKWICASLLSGNNYLLDAKNQATMYVTKKSGIEVTASVFDRVCRNIRVIIKWPFAILLIIVFVVMIIRIYQIRKTITLTGLFELVPYIYLIILPFIWYIALGNGYSYVHYWFSYRLLAITIMAGGSMLVKIGIKADCSQE